MIDINELRRLTQAATPGPWYIGSGIYEGRNIYSVEAVTDDEGFTYNPVVATAEDDEVAYWDANARLIAAANPAVISELLDRLEAAESECLEQARLNGMGGEREAALMAKLEAAEKSDAESLTMYRKARDERDALRAALQHEADCVEAAKAEIKALRAKITEMEQQEPVAWLDDGTCRAGSDSTALRIVTEATKQDMPASVAASFSVPLYALPGAQGEEK